ncbi:TonB-dependent siderophore receptor [Scytonema sp. NUACC26]|uniref:TonB-dependent siderophore receptor n=1 Tax=Scytonema sp. NUACC26 TaxID=3140176 RepID=UPI0034DC82B2
MLIKLPCAAICWLIPVLSVTIANPAYSEQPLSEKPLALSSEVNRDIRSLTELQSAKTSALYLLRTPRDKNQVSQLSQATTDVVSVTDVQVNITDKGIELILVTANSVELSVSSKIEGNSYIADISNAKLQLASGERFQKEKPVAGIAEVTVANVDTNTLRVTVTGETAAPVVELFDSQTEGLVFGVTSTTSTAQQPAPTPEQKPPANDRKQPPIELEVTAPPEGSYRVPNTSSATKTDTPLRDIPASVQVIPRAVIDDLGGGGIAETLRVIGIGTDRFSSRLFDTYTIRGFATLFTNNFRNGLREIISNYPVDISNTERIEVLRGPASVLYGQSFPGGIVNRVTKQPLNEPYYFAQIRAGSFGSYQPSVDFSGPLNTEKTLLYRLNASYLNADSFVDYVTQERYFVAPTFNWRISQNTNLTLEGEYQRDEKPNGDAEITGLPGVGTVLPNPNGQISRNRNLAEPSIGDESRQTSRIAYNFEHRLSENWIVRNAFLFGQRVIAEEDAIIPTGLQPGNRRVNRISNFINSIESNNFLDTNVIGKFKTGKIEHELLVGFDLFWQDFYSRSTTYARSPIDAFNPVYGTPLGQVTSRANTKTNSDAQGLYFQDQISLTNNLKLVLGGRLDWLNTNSLNRLSRVTTSQSDNAFSPRVGIVYQPNKNVSLYTSYTSSFNQITGTDARGNPFIPSRGQQYEVGVKTDWFDNMLSATLALYDLTRTNITTTDPSNSRFQVQTGEQKSQGVELYLTGEILPGWNIIAAYNYTNARVTRDNQFKVGNFLNAIPEHSASLWTTYTIGQGSLQGLGFGLGVFYVSDREGDLANTFILPSYVRTDAALYYRRNNLRVQLNFQNLFDTNYYVSAFNRNRVFPGAPFETQLTIGWEF